jgi:hypothetical protein
VTASDSPDPGARGDEFWLPARELSTVDPGLAPRFSTGASGETGSPVAANRFTKRANALPVDSGETDPGEAPVRPAKAEAPLEASAASRKSTPPVGVAPGGGVEGEEDAITLRGIAV